jgi:hypothetical protein
MPPCSSPTATHRSASAERNSVEISGRRSAALSGACVRRSSQRVSCPEHHDENPAPHGPYWGSPAQHVLRRHGRDLPFSAPARAGRTSLSGRQAHRDLGHTPLIPRSLRPAGGRCVPESLKVIRPSARIGGRPVRILFWRDLEIRVFRHECGSAEGCGGWVTLRGNGVGRSCPAVDLYPFREGIQPTRRFRPGRLRTRPGNPSRYAG